MADRLTDAQARTLPAPKSGNRVFYDTEVKGFGLRVTATGARSFVLNYRIGGRERRYTIGQFPDWPVKVAREKAAKLKRRVDQGEDVMAQRDEQRTARDVNALCSLFEQDHLPSRRPSTQVEYHSLIRNYIRPKLGTIRVAALTRSDVSGLHREVARRAPYRANRLLALLSGMLRQVAFREGWRPEADNPVAGIVKAQEHKRERFLSPAEIARLADALAAHPERRSVDAIRLLMMTGARRNEVLMMTWDQLDLAAGIWTKPAANTKQRRTHRIPLSAPAIALLIGIRQSVATDCPYVFPTAKTNHAGGDLPYAPLTEVRRTWSSVCRTAGITGVRLHDLRHTYASILVSAGLSLPIIGALLGHTQASTTHRYAHLMDDPLRAATERVAAALGGTVDPGTVIPLKRRV